jgi:L-malate glycosyltransferase
VTHGMDGYLVPPRDVEAAAKFALSILTLADRGRLMGQQARVNARRKYCSNDVIPHYEAFYEKVLNAAGAAAGI